MERCKWYQVTNGYTVLEDINRILLTGKLRTLI